MSKDKKHTKKENEEIKKQTEDVKEEASQAKEAQAADDGKEAQAKQDVAPEAPSTDADTKADAAAADNMVKDVIARHGRVDILVNNAGITRDNLIMRMSEQDFDDVINTNLKGAFHTIRSLSRSFLKQRSGKIINIASVVGITGNAGQANYSASKAGIIGLTKSVAREFATRGICVNAVAPGYIETEMTQALSEEATKGLMQMIPMGKAGTAQNVADLVLFLAGSGSDYITGQVIGVNGGMAM